ncbi:unnamed protein product [Closterium sp. NIES-54]
MDAQELRWLTYLLTDLGEQPRSPPVLYVDNKAMLALCREHRMEHRTKHIALRYFLARELQQRGQLRLAYVASEANTADIFTKALAPGDHQRFCTLLDVPEKCKKFWRFVRDKHWERGIETTWIINADLIPATTTVDQTGVRSVPIRIAGYQKEHVTVMLACMADGMKLKPWVFFKRKTVPKGVFPTDVVMACHENGWMDAEGVIRWLEESVKPFLKPGFRRHARSSMVVLDSYRGHLTEGVKEKFRELNCVPAIIPSGCTAEVQPLDVCINKSFKASVRQQYQKWFQEEGQEQLTRAGNLKKPPPEVVVRWISRAWKAVPADLIKRAFLTCGISNALDGSEDGLAMAHRRSQLTAEVDVDDSIIADGFFGNNCQEPESNEEE